MKYADDAMVACVFRNVNKGSKILELEFLDERFANFFSFAGFDFISLSSDEKLVEDVKNSLKDDISQKIQSLNNFEFSEISFDCLFSHLALSFKGDFIEKIKNTLKSKQKFVISALSKNDSRAKNGAKGFEASELKELFKDFKNLDINIMQTTYENKTIIDEYFIITGEKA